MNKPKTARHAKEIESRIKQLNHCWINRLFEDMEPFFHKNGVMVHSGDFEKITGRQQIIESYWEFMESADVTDFKIVNESIHVFDETAVAYYSYRIHYTVETTNYDETVSEILVFQQHNDDWQIVWRTQLPGL